MRSVSQSVSQSVGQSPPEDEDGGYCTDRVAEDDDRDDDDDDALDGVGHGVRDGVQRVQRRKGHLTREEKRRIKPVSPCVWTNHPPKNKTTTSRDQLPTHLVVEEECEPGVDEVARQLRTAARQGRMRRRGLPRLQQLG